MLDTSNGSSGGDQAAIFGHHQEQQTIDQLEQLAVIAERRQFVARQLLAQRGIGRVLKQAVAKRAQRGFHTVAQLLAHAPAGFDRLLVVFFEQAACRVGAVVRQARPVQQAVHQRKLAELLALEHRPQIELDVGRAGETRRIAQQAQPLAVRHDAPQMLGAVEVFLQQRVRRQARAAGWRARIQAGANALDMHGRRVVVLSGAVRNRVGARFNLIGALVERKLVAQHIKQRQHPAVARDGGGGVARAQVVDIGFEQEPMAARSLPRRRDPVAQVAPALQPKIFGTLTGQLLGGNRIENVGGQQAALGGDGCVGHWCVSFYASGATSVSLSGSVFSLASRASASACSRFMPRRRKRSRASRV